MQNILSDFFYFTRRERRGIYVLVVIIVLLGISNILLPYFEQNTGINFYNHERLISLYDSILNTNNTENDTISLQLFNFDPNKLDIKGWIALGLNPKQAQVIVNYRNKGGRFYQKKDLLKIYSIDSNLYSTLEPYIVIPVQTSGKKTSSHSQQQPNQLVELNSADSLQLIGIRGIGPVYASRIIKYRNLLGGYTSVSQLLEVYGIDSTIFFSLKNQFTKCNLDLIKKINLNEASFNDLLKHPYISYDFTKDIVNRRKKAVFQKAEEAFNNQFISDADFKKLLPYLSIK